jgi:hypothetical protein
MSQDGLDQPRCERWLQYPAASLVSWSPKGTGNRQSSAEEWANPEVGEQEKAIVQLPRQVFLRQRTGLPSAFFGLLPDPVGPLFFVKIVELRQR